MTDRELVIVFNWKGLRVEAVEDELVGQQQLNPRSSKLYILRLNEVMRGLRRDIRG